MNFLNDLFRGRRERSTSSAQVAKQRLLTVLVNDRVKLSPEALEQLKNDLSEVISRYVPSVEPHEIEVSLLRGDMTDHLLKAEIPLRRARLSE